ncbi:MAG: protein-L-isoaspartate O-methyltransferase, partial [Candidatus Buchananbacteria bacterium]|nr:protein-L-isoaspartate O-methyltransferase [Candidatus Buchananbacteria bacterium]
MDKLIEQFIQNNDLRSPQIIRAFERIKRWDFLPPEVVDQHLVNTPLPIGAGQTNSQPYTVAFMLELLDPQEGQKILDIGSGSGWTTALLAEIAGLN